MIQQWKPYVKKLCGDTQTPITLFCNYVAQGEGFLLESRGIGGKSEFSFLGKAPRAVLRGTVSENTLTIQENGRQTVKQGVLLEQVREYMKQYQVENKTDIPFVGGAVGCISYDSVRQYETLPVENPDVLQLPDVHLMVVTEVVAYNHLHDTIHVIVLEEDSKDGQMRASARLLEIIEELAQAKAPALFEEKSNEKITVTSNTTKEQYMEMVHKAKQYIYDGDIFQVVLSQRLEAKTEDSPLTLYRKLRAINPSPYLYYFNFGAYQVAGSSPEMLVEVKKGRVATCPIAGTRKRGVDVLQDAVLANDLKNDPKECAEHVMLVDLARNDMGRIVKIGTVEVTKFMCVQNYSHVMHMVSLVEGEKTEKEDAFSILSTFLPAGTLSGAPKIRAMEIIEELEGERRGLYAGAAGYFAFDGDMDFCIAIRTMVIKEGTVYMQAGAGIVADSDPEKEYEESHSKVRALVKTIGGDI